MTQYEKIKQRFPTLSDQVINQIIELYNSGNATEDGIYNLLRHTSIPYDFNQSDFVDATQYGRTDNNDMGIEVLDRQAWTWMRRRHERPYKRALHRLLKDKFHISLNVHVTADLLRELDVIVANDKCGFIDFYKFPKQEFSKEVSNRHDPITIYVNGRNSEIEQQIVAAARKYARSNDGLFGELLGHGIGIAPETSTKTGRSVGQQAAYEILQILSTDNTNIFERGIQILKSRFAVIRRRINEKG